MSAVCAAKGILPQILKDRNDLEMTICKVSGMDTLIFEGPLAVVPHVKS